MAVIGIDLGTTNSLVAYYKDGKSVLIPNEFGEYCTPSVVHINKKGEVIVGRAAKELLITDPENTVAVFKRSMGLERLYQLQLHAYKPEELSAFVIKKLVEDAKRELQEEIEEVIISVPAYFDDVRRKATKRAGEIAGVHVERLINEPSAAALACRMEQGDTDCVYMVFDFGGGTLDISVVECFENVISVLAVSGDNHLGGSDFDRVIADYICEQLGANWELLFKEDQAIIFRKAEQLKKLLSQDSHAKVEIDTDRLHGVVELEHQQLVDLSEDIFRRIKIPLQQVINDSGYLLEEIERVIMVGGSSKMPVVNMYLQYLLKKELITVGNPDETVARGVGVYAGMKQRNEELKQLVMTDICPFSLGTATLNEHCLIRPYFSPIIERNSVLPISKTATFCTAFDNQKFVEIRIYQGDEPYAEDNQLLDKLKIGVPPAPRGEEQVQVRFTYDINGILDVEVTILSTKEVVQKTVVKKELGLSDEVIQQQLQKMEEIKSDVRDDEKNQYVLNYLDALFRQTTGRNRQLVQGAREVFEEALSTQDGHRIRRTRQWVLMQLQQIGGMLFELDDVMKEIMEQEDSEE